MLIKYPSNEQMLHHKLPTFLKTPRFTRTPHKLRLSLVLCPDHVLQVLHSFTFSSEQQSHVEVLRKNQFVYLYRSCEVTHARVPGLCLNSYKQVYYPMHLSLLSGKQILTAIIKRKMLAYSLLESFKLCVTLTSVFGACTLDFSARNRVSSSKQR